MIAADYEDYGEVPACLLADALTNGEDPGPFKLLGPIQTEQSEYLVATRPFDGLEVTLRRNRSPEGPWHVWNWWTPLVHGREEA